MATPKPADAFAVRHLRSVTLPEADLYTVEVTAGGATTSVDRYVRQPQPTAGAKNVILFFVADGMSVPMLTAARVVLCGNTEGKYDTLFAMDQMEEVGLLHTSGMDSIITDSANSASAYNTGHKSALNALGVYPDTSEDTLDDLVKKRWPNCSSARSACPSASSPPPAGPMRRPLPSSVTRAVAPTATSWPRAARRRPAA